MRLPGYHHQFKLHCLNGLLKEFMHGIRCFIQNILANLCFESMRTKYPRLGVEDTPHLNAPRPCSVHLHITASSSFMSVSSRLLFAKQPCSPSPFSPSASPSPPYFSSGPSPQQQRRPSPAHSPNCTASGYAYSSRTPTTKQCSSRRLYSP